MKPRIACVLALFFVWGATAPAAFAGTQEAMTVAVYDFTGEAEARSYGSKVTTLVTADLATQTNLIMLGRAELKKALSEQAFGVSGMVSSDAAAKIGQITGAKVLVCGQVLTTEQNHLVIVATIIGTETGRLFAAKVDGPANHLVELTSDLSSKIAQTIANQTTNLIAPGVESSAARLERIVKSITATNRPSISVNIFWGRRSGHCNAAEVEFGSVLLKAGFPVVDGSSERKPDVEITGKYDNSEGPHRDGLFSCHCVIEVKAQQRRSGNIIIFDREEGLASDATRVGADRSAMVQAMDGLAGRMLPVLAK